MAVRINRATIVSLFVAFTTAFNKRFKAYTPRWDKFAMLVEEAGDFVHLGFLEDFPGIKEWIGDRHLTELTTSDYTIKFKDWADGIKVKAKDVKHDKMGLYAPKMDMLARAARYHPDRLGYNLLNQAISTSLKAFDGVAFFATTGRTWRGSTLVNKYTLALSPTSFQTVYNGLVDAVTKGGADNEPPLDQEPEFILMVSSQDISMAESIVQHQTNATGGQNPNYKKAELMVCADLTAGSWYLYLSNNPVKPLVFIREEDYKPTELDADSDFWKFMRNEYLFGIDARYNMGLGLPYIIAGSLPAS